MTQTTWEEGTGLFDLHIPRHSPLREAKSGTQGKNLEAGADAEAMKESYVLACSVSSLIFPGSPKVSPLIMIHTNH